MKLTLVDAIDSEVFIDSGLYNLNNYKILALYYLDMIVCMLFEV